MNARSGFDYIVRRHGRLLLLVAFPLFPFIVNMLAAWDELD